MLLPIRVKSILILLVWPIASFSSEKASDEAAPHGENLSTRIPYESEHVAVSKRQPRWSDFLPIWGREAREKGYVLPLPLGVSVGYMHQKQPFDVNSIQINGTDFIESGLVSIDQVENEEGTYTLRLDTWVFPFFNVYGILGVTQGRAQGPISLDITPLAQEVANRLTDSLNAELCSGYFAPPTCPSPLNPPIVPQFPRAQHQIDLNYRGDVLGGGFTIAGGYKNFFGMIDINKTYTNLDISHVDAKALVTSGRIGWNGNIGIFNGSLWLGAMHQDINQTLDLKLDLPAELGFIESISIDQTTASPLNGVVGGRWTFTEEFEALLELGIGSRQSVLISGSYRF